VWRRSDGSFATSATDAGVRAAARGRHVALTPLDSAPAGAAVLRRPRVALFGDVGGDDSSGDLSAGWARWLLRRRYGLAGQALSAAGIASGELTGYDALVVPAGTTENMPAAALTALQTWVRAGGTLVAWGGRGLAVAQAAGVTAVRTAATPSGLQIPGAELRIALSVGDPVALGEQPDGFAFNTGDPVLAPHGAPVVAAYPSGAGFFVSGYTSGTDALQGTAAATDEVAGSGRVVLFAFDPAFRGYTDGTMRLVGNALLAPAPTGSRSQAARAVGAIDPDALAAAPSPVRDSTIQVAAEDEAALLRAAAAAGVPKGFALEHDLTTVTLRVANPLDLSPAQRPWTLRLPAALRAAGVTPILAII
jgi:hypothetical protein